VTAIPLKRVASVRVSNVDKKSVDGEIPVRLCNYTDVYYQHSITPDLDLMQATATREQVGAFRLCEGDVVITKDSETADDIGVAAYVERTTPDLICGYHLAVLRPDPEVLDARFLYWAVSSQRVRDWVAVSATGVTRFGLRSEAIAATPVVVHPLTTQRAIADYLDAETVRIDALIEKKRALGQVLMLWLDSQREALLPSSTHLVPLARLTDPARPIMYGIVLPGPDVPDGVPIVKGGDVAGGLLSYEGLARTTFEIESGYARSRLRGGDLVYAIRGGIGDVAEVPESVAGANITQDVARVAPDNGVSGRWLLHVLLAPSVQAEAELRTTGATIRGLNIWELQRLPIPWVDSEHQHRLGEEADRAMGYAHDGLASLTRQIRLLQEHRQALITAAVTGEISVG
jgi:type I restriction enzyme S subunit